MTTLPAESTTHISPRQDVEKSIATSSSPLLNIEMSGLKDSISPNWLSPSRTKSREMESRLPEFTPWSESGEASNEIV